MEKEQGLKGYIRQNRAELFREIEDLIQNEDVTDIEWDGYYLWVTDLKKGCYCHNIRAEMIPTQPAKIFHITLLNLHLLRLSGGIENRIYFSSATALLLHMPVSPASYPLFHHCP